MVVLHQFTPGPRIVPMGLGWISLFCWGVALTVGISAEWQFWKRGASVLPLRTPPHLVREGVYRFSRNPMYVSLILICAGVAVQLGTTTPWIAVVLFALWLDRVFVRREEDLLQAHFGETYREYCNRVRRWL